MNLGKRLTLENIERSQKIQSWLTQFSTSDVNTAKLLLCRLQFISRDEYADWLLSKLNEYSCKGKSAIYAVRKFKKTSQCLWQEDGTTYSRPAQTQGSEDLVSSIISNANRQHNNCFLDHPCLNEIRKQKVRHIILVDDSIGSGKRVADFIQRMTNSKTFMSWWSGGYINLHILSYARTRQSQCYILDKTPGSDHGIRKIRLSQKLHFDSDLVYDANNLRTRWGDNSQSISDLCSSMNKIPERWRRGFGNVMGNIIFYHSVPNNIPGLLFCRNNKGWVPLFPNRSLPKWIRSLLERNTVSDRSSGAGCVQLQVSSSMVKLLKLIKSGLRTRASLSRRLDYDEQIVQDLVDQAVQLGFISENNRLLPSGRDYLFKDQKRRPERTLDYSLYIPKSWCAAQKTVQPSAHDASLARVQTDSIDSKSMDGDDGKSSLERTDAIATTSPIARCAALPAWTRAQHILQGPLDLKE